MNVCDNEKLVGDYTLNGVALGEYAIVADAAFLDIAQNLCEAVNDRLGVRLSVLDAENFCGGHAIKIGSFKCCGYGGERYVISSEAVGGISTICIDGECRELLEEGVVFFAKKYLSATEGAQGVTIPEKMYVHVRGKRFYEVSSEKSTLMEGVRYYRKHYNNFEDKNVDVFITEVSGDSPARFGVWVADTDSKSGKAQLEIKTVGTLASELNNTGVKVIAAVNSGYFHMAAKTFYPWGMQIVDGNVISEPSHEDDRYSNDWLGMTFDGEFVGGNTEDYENIYKGKLKYGIGCGGKLLANGVLTEKSNPYAKGVCCLTAIAFTKDGGFVLLCVDGRPHLRNGKSEGASFFDMISIFRDLDLEYTDAYILDGGGSTEMVIRGDNEFITVNDPSDGRSRRVSDIIAAFIP